MAEPFFLQVRWGMGAALCSLALVAGCGGGGGGSVGSTPVPQPIPTPTPSPTPSPTPTPTATPTPIASFQTSEYNRSNGPVQHGALTAWAAGYSGSGITLGIVDTGIDTGSAEFAGRIAAASADVAADRGLNPEDDHGTNVALVAAAARDNTGVVGTAFNATIAMFRADKPGSCATYDASVKDSGCKFNDSDIATGLDRAVAAGARVINLSLGGSSPTAGLRAAVSRAVAAGAVIVVSAGNDGESTDPADDPANPDLFATGLQAAGSGAVIIAGSVDGNEAFSAFSNRAGTWQDWFLSARGERVCCVYENGVMKVVNNADGTRSVYVFSGTSFAAPQIAGAAALLRQAFPNLTAQQVVEILLKTAKDAGTAGTDSTYGRGILDIAAAFSAQGVTSLAGTGQVLPSSDTTLVGSAPMGDAGSQIGGLQAVVLDAYGRAYGYDLALGMRSAGLAPRLDSALRADRRNLTMGAGRLALAFSIDASGRTARLPWQGALHLAARDAQQARVLAARAALQLAPDRQLGFVFRQGADGLVAQLQGRSDPAFLIAQGPADTLGLGSADQLGLALRQRLGPWGLTLSGERGRSAAAATARREASSTTRLADVPAMRLGAALDRRWDAVDGALGVSWLGESRSILGARLHGALGPGGADSLFADAALGWQVDPRWRISAAWRGGLTWAHANGLVAGNSRLLTSAWALDASRTGLFQQDDSMALRLAQPLRVERGGLNLRLPVDYSYATLSPVTGLRRLSLSPHGRELDAELMWRGALWNGAASASLFWRKDPGHYASLPDDRGVAISWNRQF